MGGECRQRFVESRSSVTVSAVIFIGFYSPRYAEPFVRNRNLVLGDGSAVGVTDDAVLGEIYVALA